MNKSIHFELVSPERKLVSEPVLHAVIPGEEGEMGIGPDHSAFVVALKPGVVQLYKNNEEPHRIFIAGGFADITNKSCTVLAEEAVNVNELNQTEIEQQIRDLTEDMGLAAEPGDKARVARKLKLTKARLEAITGRVVF